MRSALWPSAFVTCVVALVVTACQGAETKETAASVAADSALNADLEGARADTGAFSEAADVAMANPRRGEGPVGEEPIPESAPVTNRVPSTRPSGGGVGMRAVPTEERPQRVSPPASRPTTPTPAASPVSPSPRPAPLGGPSCESPALADQRRCLLEHLARSDVRLDRNYQALITALKSEAGTGPRDPEPGSVARLRVAQRAWLVYRDTECRRRNRGKEGPLWAPLRAQCLGEFSSQRTQELASELAKRR
jgi:uncharacterized protein YecT (DUF1311 family)